MWWIIDTKRTVPTKSILTKQTSTIIVQTISTSTNFDILLYFVLTTTASLIAVSTYCNLIKSRAKQKHLLPYNGTIKVIENDVNNKL